MAVLKLIRDMSASTRKGLLFERRYFREKGHVERTAFHHVHRRDRE